MFLGLLVDLNAVDWRPLLIDYLALLEILMSLSGHTGFHSHTAFHSSRAMMTLQ